VVVDSTDHPATSPMSASLVIPCRMCIAIALAVGMFVTGLAAVVPTVDAQPASRKARVGTLGITPTVAALNEQFINGISSGGYVEGQHFEIAAQHGAGDPARLPASAAALVQAGSDVIFARGAAALVAAMQATRTVPIVAVDLESDPVALGYAKSLARPDGNVTGVFLDLPELSAKQLQLFREIMPKLSRVALLGDSTGNAPQFRATERAAAGFGLQTRIHEGRTLAELQAGLEAASRSGAGGVIIFSSPLVFFHRERLATMARERRLPAVSLFTEFAEAGGLLTYGPSLRESFWRCGAYVARILGGRSAAELPIERPEKFDFVINLRTARALGLTIPPAVRARADHVIE
jgi:putative ABC transport system substrate-binding protein